AKVGHIIAWNIRSFNNKDQEVMQELNEHKIDICAIQESRIKGKGKKQYSNYVLIYSEVERQMSAKEGVALTVHNTYNNNILE
ncbi:hypothetical protein HHI36_009104, partial [Cryptolaemus montrouzieri]